MSIFTILRQPFAISVTVSLILIKVTNDYFIFYTQKITTEGSLLDKIDLQALYRSGTYCHKTGTRPPSCQTPLQPTIYFKALQVVLVN